MGAGLLAVYLLGRKIRSGFISFMLGNALGVVVGFMADSIAIAIGNVAFLLLNLRGWIQWKPEGPEQKEAMSTA